MFLTFLYLVTPFSMPREFLIDASESSKHWEKLNELNLRQHARKKITRIYNGYRLVANTTLSRLLDSARGFSRSKKISPSSNALNKILRSQLDSCTFFRAFKTLSPLTSGISGDDYHYDHFRRMMRNPNYRWYKIQLEWWKLLFLQML